jgi:hypothetical protein
MSFFGWFKSTPQPARGQAAFPREAATGVRAPAETKDAAVQVKEAATNTAERRKNERSRLRELLYKVVRESMVRVGVLSSSFKFKVLATDPRGRKFIVMMDLSRDFGSEISQLAEIENLICQAAKARYNIVVSAVYWRAEDVTAANQPGDASAGPKYRATLPAASEAVAESASLTPPPANRPAFEPVLAAEISALKQALAAGASPAAAGAQAQAGDPHAPKLTGFENTEIIESRLPDTEIAETEMLDDDPPYPALSPTQYGELR